MSLTSKVIAAVIATYARVAGQGAKSFDLDYQIRRELASGVASGQADLAYKTAAGGLSVGAGTFTDIDLNGSTLDPIGDALAMVRVKEILLYGYDTNAADMLLGAAAANAFAGFFGGATHQVRAAPGGFVHLYNPAGYVVTPGTADLLRLTNANGAGVGLADMILLATSA
jgi:hypothetical protein